MNQGILKKTIFISFFSHIAAFSIFSLSFGNIPSKANYTSVSFLGQVLYNAQVAKPLEAFVFHKEGTFFRQQMARHYLNPARGSAVLDNGIIVSCWLKPQCVLTFTREKEEFKEKPQVKPASPAKKDQAIIFHPLLPYGFCLYFNDRQIAHVELMFKVEPFRLRDSVIIKRSISSGNLEVDLLSMRYISHYLFIKGPGFSPNDWRAVKIDLSAKEY